MLIFQSAHLIITLLLVAQSISLSVIALKLSAKTRLKLTDKSAEDNDPAYEIRCPIEMLAVYKGDKNEKYTKFQQLINLVSVTWKKNNKPFMWRENGNKFDANLDKFKLILYQFGDSDTGTYSCHVNYTSVPDELGQEFELFESAQYNVVMPKPMPDLRPIVTHPPKDFYIVPGGNVTFTCHKQDTLTQQFTIWVKSCPSLSKSDPCVDEFLKSAASAIKDQSWDPVLPYLLNADNTDTLTVENITEDKIGFYACGVRNHNGIDLRIGSIDFLENHYKHQYEAKIDYVRQHPPTYTPDWLWFFVGFVGFFLVAIVVASCICIFKARLLRNKKLSTAPLLSQITGLDASNNKDSSSRKRLPTIEAPDIYNTGKSLDGFITGHFHQEAGQIMAQSICGNLLNKVNPSISSSNSHQSDEASSSWGKSSQGENFRTIYSHGDNFRAFYSHGSNSTATTVPLYDHPPSTGTLRRCGTFVQNACVINPSYWLLNPENDTTEWNFPRRNLDRLDKIGEGQFGEVWRYIARSRDGTGSIVAVKKLKDERCASISERSELRAEIEIMKAVNKHPNVIKLLHCCIDDCGPILLIMEYAENGKLQTYLRSCRATSRKLYSDRDEKLTTRQNVTSKELIKFTYHIAKGMEYVASQGIVHRDLASRNILVSKDRVCKVADFGFARRVDDDCIYVRKSTNPVPVKWMAPEALEENKFTLKSDVFSLGILMWEIVTLGATPYEQLASEEVYKKVTTGGRLERPPHCKDEFYTLMAQCWTQDPALRPTFKEVAQKLERLLLSENDYIELDQYPEHAYYNIVNAAEKEVVRISM